MSKVKPALCILLFMFSSLRISATTVLVIITPSGIGIAADSKVMTVYFGGKSGHPEGPTGKLVVIHDRIAVGTIGVGSEEITTLDDRPLFIYDPSLWLRQIERNTPGDITVRQLVEVIRSESHSTFSRLNELIHNGTIKQQQTPQLKGIQYIVAGFESGVAIVEEINFEVDWKNRQLIGPTVEPVFPGIGTRVDFGFHAASMGYNSAVSDVLGGKANSKSLKLVANEAGAELKILLARKDLSMTQASTLLHAILRAQNRNTPEAVGPPYDILWLLRDGGVSWIKKSD